MLYTIRLDFIEHLEINIFFKYISVLTVFKLYVYVIFNNYLKKNNNKTYFYILYKLIILYASICLLKDLNSRTLYVLDSVVTAATAVTKWINIKNFFYSKNDTRYYKILPDNGRAWLFL